MLNQLVGRAHAAIDFNSITIPLLGTQGGSTSLPAVVSRVILFMLYISAILAVVYLIYGGITYITAGGDTERATKGRTALINAIIGIVIIALAFLIVRWVIGVLQAGVQGTQ
jgi:small-conductance mechanosensitive channel